MFGNKTKMSVVQEFEEKVDLQALKYMVVNFDDLYPLLGRFVDRQYSVIDKEQARSVLTEFLRKKVETNMVGYKYASRAKSGRLYSVGPSLQGISRVVRHTIARDLYWDVDMKNAHPVLLGEYCHKHNIPCPALDILNANRDACIAEIMTHCDIGRDEAKRVMLSFLNGGKCKLDLPNFARLIENEMASIRAQVVKNEPKLYRRAKESKGSSGWNLDGSTINLLLCDLENKTLQIMIEWLLEHGFKIGTLCFDGLMVEKDETKDILGALRSMESVIKDKMNSDIVLAVKEMDEGITLNVPDNDIHVEALTISPTTGFRNIHLFDSNPLYLMDVLNKYDGQKFVSRHDAMKSMIGDIIKVFAIIDSTSRLAVVKESSEEPALVVKLGVATSMGSDMNQFVVWINDKGVPILQLFTKETCLRYLMVDSIPYSPLERYEDIDRSIWGDRTFNTFKGFPVQIVDTIDMSLVDPWLNHLKMLINDSDLYEFFIQWVANIVQKPRDKPGTAVLFTSKPGAGKNAFVDHLRVNVLGHELTNEFQGFDNVVSRFNGHLSGKLLCVVDEVSTLQESYHNTFDKLKGIITAPTLTIERKGENIKSRPERNSNRIIALSNHAHTLKVEDGDRRWMCVNCSREKVGDYEYFDKLFSFQTAESGRHLLTYLLTKVNITKNLKKVPMTDIKHQMAEMSQSRPKLFLSDLVTEHESNDIFTYLMAQSRETFGDKFVTDDYWIFSCEDLFNAFQAWIQRNAFTCKLNSKAFGMDLSDIIGKSRPMKTKKGKVVKVYEIKRK